LVTFREWIRLYQVFDFVDELVLTIQQCLADAGLAPQMMVLVDTDVAFRRAGELDTGRCGGDLVDIEAACLFYRQLPQPWPEICRLRNVADDALVAIGLL
jgi:hypothetical protein